MNDVIKELFERKSVRVYSDEMIEEDKKKLIIDAARFKHRQRGI